MDLRIFIFVSLLIVNVFGDFEYPDDWVDPGDMLTFDPALKKNVKPNKKPSVEPTLKFVSNSGATQDASNEKSSNKCECPEITCPEQTCPVCESDEPKEESGLFLRRFVAFLVHKFYVVGEPPAYPSYHANIKIGAKDWKILKQLDDESENIAVQEALHKLESMFVEVVPGEVDRDISWKFVFEDYFHVSIREAIQLAFLVFLLIVSLTLQALSRVRWRSQLTRLFVVAFVISFVMTYFHEYKLAVAEQRSSVFNVPDHCKDNSKPLSLWDSIKVEYRDLFSTKPDPCREYHEKFLVHPIITVPPTKVLAVTGARFFLEPLSHFGKAFSETFRNMFSELPLQLWIPAFVFIILLMAAVLMLIAESEVVRISQNYTALFLITTLLFQIATSSGLVVHIFLTLCFGYSWNVNLPFWSGIQIAPHQNLQQAHHVEQLMESNRQQLQIAQAAVEAVGRQAEQNRALPPPPAAARADKNPGMFGSLSRWFRARGNPPEEPDQGPAPDADDQPPYPTHHPAHQPREHPATDNVFPMPPPPDHGARSSTSGSTGRTDGRTRSGSDSSGLPYPPLDGSGACQLRRRHRAPAPHTAPATPPYPVAQAEDDQFNSGDYSSPVLASGFRRSVPSESDAYPSSYDGDSHAPSDRGEPPSYSAAVEQDTRSSPPDSRRPIGFEAIAANARDNSGVVRASSEDTFTKTVDALTSERNESADVEVTDLASDSESDDGSSIEVLSGDLTD